MIFVEQTRLGAPGGNCVAACVASILGIRIDDVPDLSPEGVERRVAQGDLRQAPGGWDPQDWAVAEFVKERGLDAQTVYPWCDEGDRFGFSRLDVSGLTIASAWSQRLAGHGHAVVMLDGDLLWDPHPDRHMGVGPVFGWLIFTMNGERLRPWSFRRVA